MEGRFTTAFPVREGGMREIQFSRLGTSPYGQEVTAERKPGANRFPLPMSDDPFRLIA